MELIGLLVKVEYTASPKALLVVAFEDFVFNMDFEILIQVIKIAAVNKPATPAPVMQTLKGLVRSSSLVLRLSTMGASSLRLCGVG